MKPTATIRPSNLQIALDQEVGFENRIDSRIRSLRRGYDDSTGEYVIWIEYRTRVRPGFVKLKLPKPTRYPLMHKVNER